MTARPILAAHGYATASFSFQQQHIWHAPHRASHNIPPMLLLLRGRLRLDVLQSALNAVVARHEVLRTAVTAQFESSPLQVVASYAAVPIFLDDLSARPAAEAWARVREIVRMNALKAFDLGEPPLMRAGLVRFDESDHVLWIVLHHLVADLWSMKILARELGEIYAAVCCGHTSELPPLPVQYNDYVVWQRQMFEAGYLRDSLSHWRKQIDGTPALALKHDDVDPEAIWGGRVASCVFPAGLSMAVKTFAREQMATPFMVLLSAFLLLLHEETEQIDVAVDSLVANRDRAECEGLIGMFAGTAIIRAHVAPDSTYRDLLATVRANCLACYQHQHLTFRKAAEWLAKSEGLIPMRPKVLFALQTAPIRLPLAGELQLSLMEDPGVTLLANGLHPPLWEQAWQVWTSQAGLRVVVIYGAALFRDGRIRAMLERFTRIVEAALRAPDRPVEFILMDEQRA